MTTQQEGRGAPTRVIAQRYRQAAQLQELHREFTQKGYVKLTGLFEAELASAIAAEVQRLEPTARPRNFRMDGYGTPRVLAALGGSKIAQASSLLAELYGSAELRASLAQITGAPVYPCQHAEEFMVINYLNGPGATHGWHLDDPAYALVCVVVAPPPEHGGCVEFIPDWAAHCQAAAALPELDVERTIARSRARIRRRVFRSGDIYLMRADRCLHRVTELTAPEARRVALNLAFEQTPSPRYGHTATALYGG